MFKLLFVQLCLATVALSAAPSPSSPAVAASKGVKRDIGGNPGTIANLYARDDDIYYNQYPGYAGNYGYYNNPRGLDGISPLSYYNNGYNYGYGNYGGLNGYGNYGGLNGYGNYGGLSGYGNYGGLSGYGNYGGLSGYGLGYSNYGGYGGYGGYGLGYGAGLSSAYPYSYYGSTSYGGYPYGGYGYNRYRYGGLGYGGLGGGLY